MTVSNITIRDLLKRHGALLPVSDSAKLDVELLLCHCLQKETSYLRTWPDALVEPAVIAQFEALLQRRMAGEPVAYLLGEQGFWTLMLEVSPCTLIPRPETELLVEQSLLLGSEHDTIEVVDLGTGTGAIALALASERPHWRIVGCDIEIESVALAQKNGNRQPNLNNVVFIQSNWFEALDQRKFDLIISNPPYIDSHDPHLHQGDVRFEPSTALVSDNNGLADITHIISLAGGYLNSEGWLLLEHGWQQGDEVKRLLTAAGFVCVFGRQDLAGLDRISGGQMIRLDGVIR